MKQKIIILFVLMLSVSFAMAQSGINTVLPLIGENAPSFKAESTNGTLNFPKDCGDNWKVIFSHPADFTPVCSSELLDLSALQDDFKKMNVDIVVVSTDNIEKHNQWKTSIESVTYKNRPSEKINFPLVADEDHSIAKKYGMIHPESNTTKDVRGVFIIDPNNKIRAMFYYPMNIGRNMDEIKRTVLALQTADKDQVLIPAGWKSGDDVLVPY
jgi:peroxiredoxin (alkyl hydroperoxide reductase subunit C)